MACSRIRPFFLSVPGSLGLGRRCGLGVAWLALACGTNTGGQTGDEHTDSSDGIEELTGTAQRLAASGDLPNSASADGWSFGWKFYGVEADVERNVFFSPYSVSTAASMLVAGAAGTTESEIQSALDFSNSGDVFHQARNTVSQALAARNRAGSEEDNEQVLRVVNDLWLEPSFRPRTTFLDTLSAYYGASVYLAPFSTNPDAARVAINDKVEADTQGLIENLLPPGSVNDVVAVLTNALYFKANWANPFVEVSTADAPFQTASGSSVMIPMMHTRLLPAAHAVTEDFTAIAVPYFDNELELVAIMPPADEFESFVSTLDAETVTEITNAMTQAPVDLGFPKLTLEAEVPLADRLKELGVLAAFDAGQANFSNLSDTDVYLSDAFHKATLVIDEKGTQAAAATAFTFTPVSEPSGVVPITLDHPFVFFIRDVETNALLFVGHYANP